MPRYTSEGVSGVIDGRLWVLPGVCGDCAQGPIRQLFRYDPAKNTWVARKAAPHYHRQAAGGVIDGKFYVAGGLDDRQLPGAALDVYDPTTDTWRTLAPVPTAGRAIGTVLGGKLWVIVGNFYSGSAQHAYAYDPGINTWKSWAAPTWAHFAVVPVTLNGQAHLLAVSGFHEVSYTPYFIPNDSELYTR